MRPFDIPWFIVDNKTVGETFHWAPRRKLNEILEEIAVHAEATPEWNRLVQ